MSRSGELVLNKRVLKIILELDHCTLRHSLELGLRVEYGVTKAR